MQTKRKRRTSKRTIRNLQLNFVGIFAMSLFLSLAIATKDMLKGAITFIGMAIGNIIAFSYIRKKVKKNENLGKQVEG